MEQYLITAWGNEVQLFFKEFNEVESLQSRVDRSGTEAWEDSLDAKEAVDAMFKAVMSGKFKVVELVDCPTVEQARALVEGE